MTALCTPMAVPATASSPYPGDQSISSWRYPQWTADIKVTVVFAVPLGHGRGCSGRGAGGPRGRHSFGFTSSASTVPTCTCTRAHGATPVWLWGTRPLGVLGRSARRRPVGARGSGSDSPPTSTVKCASTARKDCLRAASGAPESLRRGVRLRRHRAFTAARWPELLRGALRRRQLRPGTANRATMVGRSGVSGRRVRDRMACDRAGAGDPGRDGRGVRLGNSRLARGLQFPAEGSRRGLCRGRGAGPAGQGRRDWCRSSRLQAGDPVEQIREQRRAGGLAPGEEAMSGVR